MTSIGARAVLMVTVPYFDNHAWCLLAFLRALVPDEPEDPAAILFCFFRL